MTIPDPTHHRYPSPLMTVRFRGGIVVTAPADLWFDQDRARALIGVLFSHAPPPLPEDDYREFVGDLVEGGFEAGDPNLAVFDWRIEEQEELAARLRLDDLDDDPGEAA